MTVLLRGAWSCVRRLPMGNASSVKGSGRGNRVLTGGVRGSSGARSPASGIVKSIAALAMQSFSNPHLATPRLRYVLRSFLLHVLLHLLPALVREFHNKAQSSAFPERGVAWVCMNENRRTFPAKIISRGALIYSPRLQASMPPRAHRARLASSPPAWRSPRGSLRLGYKITLAGGLARCLPVCGRWMLRVGAEGWVIQVEQKDCFAIMSAASLA